MYRELIKNLEINRCNNVTAIPKALGETAQVVQWNLRNIYNKGVTAIGQGGDDAEMITLDSLNLCSVSLIKMDIECYERYVFEGARETILKKPSYYHL